MASRLTRQEILQETRSELLANLGSGQINAEVISKAIEYEGLEFEDWDRVKRVHFCLGSEFNKFIDKLPNRIRRMKTETERQELVSREVRGTINWSSTIRGWSDTGYSDTSEYTSETPHSAYNIPENLVLKRLLWILANTLDEDLRVIESDWRYKVWPDDRIEWFTRFYRKNIHLNRIKKGSRIRLSERDLTAARRSRQPLYKETHEFLRQYQRLDHGYIDEDVGNTLIEPLEDFRLFEFFCTFQILRLINNIVGDVKLHTIETGQDVFARYSKGSYRIDIYHDEIGDLHFEEKIDDRNAPEDELYRRYHDSILEYIDRLSEIADVSHEPTLYRGRPDLVVEIYDMESPSERLCASLLGEFKHSNDRSQFRLGLEELVRYLKFAKITDGATSTYLSDDSDILLWGVLVTNGVGYKGTARNVTQLDGRQLSSEDLQNNLDGFVQYLSTISRGQSTTSAT